MTWQKVLRGDVVEGEAGEEVESKGYAPPLIPKSVLITLGVSFPPLSQKFISKAAPCFSFRLSPVFHSNPHEGRERGLARVANHLGEITMLKSWAVLSSHRSTTAGLIPPAMRYTNRLTPPAGALLSPAGQPAPGNLD